MELSAALSDVRHAIESTRPQDLSVHDFLRQLVETYVPHESAELSERQAEAILLARGLLARQRLTQAEGGSISAPEVARVLGITRQGVDYQRREGLLLAWRTTEGRWHYPVWQFTANGMLPGVRECLQSLGTDHEWGALIFFLSRRDSLGGKRPLDVLKSATSTKPSPPPNATCAMALDAPPGDLHDRPLVSATLPDTIWRISQRKYVDPLHWSKKGANRFDAPLHLYGVLYAAGDPECALLEMFGDTWAEDRVIQRHELDDFDLCTLTVSRPVSVADLTGDNLNRLGTDSNLFASLRYDLTRPWVNVLMTHPAHPHGILYHSRKNPLRYSYALFGTPLAKSSLTVVDRRPLTQYPCLMRVLLKYDVALL